MASKFGLKGSSLISNNNRKTQSSGTSVSLSYGKVFGVVNGINLPTPTQYERAGGKIGTIFYLDADSSKNIIGNMSDTFLNTCLLASPISPNTQYYPLINELVNIVVAPSMDFQTLKDAPKNTSYWSQIVNIWGDSQQNAQSPAQNVELGKTFTETNNKNLISYEGDYILSGRKSNSMRFSSTVGLFSNIIQPNYNEWSKVGDNGSPILILSNGHNYNSTALPLYVEQINKDASSIYLTSTQVLPLEVDRIDIQTPLNNPVDVDKYHDSQVILNGDRLVFNSKKDEILLFSKTNIGLNTNNSIILNAKNNVYLNSNNVYLGSSPNNTLPQEPLLFGHKTIDLLGELISALRDFSSTSSSSTAITGAPGDSSPIIQLKSACDNLNTILGKLQKQLEPDSKNYLASNKIFIS
jgi:hypothetical protein